MQPVKFVLLRENGTSPKRESPTASGWDLRWVPERGESELTLEPMQRTCFPTGIAVEVAVGFELQIRPRSGLAFHHGVTVLNAPGTIDSDYRGEVGVVLINLGGTEYTILAGDRIAQAVVCPVSIENWQLVDKLGTTDRGDGGYGSTGK